MNCYHKKHRNLEKSCGLTLASVLVSISLLVLGFLYLLQTNSLVGCSYKIRQQKEHLSELENKRQEIETEIADWQSPAKLKQVVDSLNMIEMGGAIYLDREEKSMTMKNF